jgi:putative membrane protein (TIGR04086 family)
MNKNTVSKRGVKTLKSFLYALLSFVIFVLIIGILVRFTPLPERWASIYVLLALCLSCLLLGLFTGGLIGKRGILYGGIYSIFFIFIIMILSILMTGVPSERGLLQPQYLLCIACGSLGGIVGVNLR